MTATEGTAWNQRSPEEIEEAQWLILDLEFCCNRECYLASLAGSATAQDVAEREMARLAYDFALSRTMAGVLGEDDEQFTALKVKVGLLMANLAADGDFQGMKDFASMLESAKEFKAISKVNNPDLRAAIAIREAMDFTWEHIRYPTKAELGPLVVKRLFEQGQIDAPYLDPPRISEIWKRSGLATVLPE